jgi:hypothetical protein
VTGPQRPVRFDESQVPGSPDQPEFGAVCIGDQAVVLIRQ